MDALDEPGHTTSVVFYKKDVEEMRRIYGRGWTEIVRNLVREHLNRRKRDSLQMR